MHSIMSIIHDDADPVTRMKSRLPVGQRSVRRLQSSVTVAVLVLCTLATFGGHIVYNDKTGLLPVVGHKSILTYNPALNEELERRTLLTIQKPRSRKLPVVASTSTPQRPPYAVITDKYAINCPERCRRTNFSSAHSTSGQKDGDDRHVYLLIIVHSSMDHFTQRARIRRTWSNESMLTLRTWRRHPATEKVQTKSSIRIETVFVIGQAAPSVVSGDHHVNNSDNTKGAGMNQNSSRRHENLQVKLEEEAMKNGDIVQGMFVDTYRNMTYKHLTALQWIINYCNNATFIMKTDDDAFVNIFAVVQHLLDIENYRQNTPLSGSDAKQYHHHNSSYDQPPTSASQQITPSVSNLGDPGLLICLAWKDPPVARRGKWAVTKNEVPYTTYPPYCSGVGYIMTPDVPRQLIRQAVAFSSLHGQPFWIDDVYVTGLLVRALNGSVRQFDMSKAFCSMAKMKVLYGHPQEWFKYVITHVKGLDDSGNQNAELFEYTWKGLVRVATDGMTTPVIPRPRHIRPGRLAECYRPFDEILRVGVGARCIRLHDTLDPTQQHLTHEMIKTI